MLYDVQAYFKATKIMLLPLFSATYSHYSSQKNCVVPKYKQPMLLYSESSSHQSYLLRLSLGHSWRLVTSKVNEAPTGKHTQYVECAGTCPQAVSFSVCNILQYFAPPHHDKGNQGRVHMWQDYMRRKQCVAP